MNQQETSFEPLPLVATSKPLTRPKLNTYLALQEWIVKVIRPYLHGKMIELNSREGGFTDLFLKNKIRLRISDSDENYHQFLQEKYQSSKAIKGIHKVDLHHNAFEKRYESYLSKFHAVIILNDINIYQNAGIWLTNASKLIQPEGYLILFTAVNIVMFSQSDEEVEFWWKENRKHQKTLLPKDLELVASQYVNVQSVSGPWLHFPIAELREFQIKPPDIYNKMVPIFQIPNKNLVRQIGLSTTLIAQKQSKPQNKTP